jgi:RNA polymerase sigma-70 factor (TIGR02943 family)
MSSPDTRTPEEQLDPAHWVQDHGDCLYRFALIRVSRQDEAEDLVQDTLLAALKSRSSFAGRSTVRTWLLGIMKNKLIDRLRKKHRTVLAADAAAGDEWLDQLYDRSGHWSFRPRECDVEPALLLQRQEFWSAFETCRRRLPDRLGEVLSLRLLDDVPAEQICQALGISATNLWTLLHRARVRLWRCLEQKGFGTNPLGNGP